MSFNKEMWHDSDKCSKFRRTSPSRVRVDERERANMCNYCHLLGHWKNECPSLKSKEDAKIKSISSLVKPVALAETVLKANNIHKSSSPRISSFSPFVTDGSVRLVDSEQVVPVKILRDTGSAESFVLQSVLPFSNDSYTGNNVLIRGIGLNVISVPIHKLVLNSDLIQGEVEVAVRSCLPVEGVQVILGNDLAGDRVWRNVSPNLVVTSSELTSESGIEDLSCSSNVFPSCVTTRSMSKIQGGDRSEEKRVSTVLEIPSILTVSREDLIREQKADSTLIELFDRVVPNDTIVDLSSGYYLDGGVLCRKWVPHEECVIVEPMFQVVVPQSLRQLVLQTTHDTSGHLGVKKTYRLLLKQFFWPKIKRDISKYMSCQTCQLTGKPNQSAKPAPLYPIPSISQPFEHLLIGCVGQLPRLKTVDEYLPAVMCQVTRYPAGYPLHSTTADVKALTWFISVFGIPGLIESDQGSNFTSNLFGEVLKSLHVQHNLSSAFHPQSQGALSRFLQALKSMLKSYCTQMDWKQTDPPKNVVSYASDFHLRMSEACQLVKGFWREAWDLMWRLLVNVLKCLLQSGDRVLALVAVVGSPFQAELLDSSNAERLSNSVLLDRDAGDLVVPGCIHGTLNNYLSHLSHVHCTDLINLIHEYVALFSDTTFCTNLIEHNVDVRDSIPIRRLLLYCRVLSNRKKQLKGEVDYVLKMTLAAPWSLCGIF